MNLAIVRETGITAHIFPDHARIFTEWTPARGRKAWLISSEDRNDRRPERGGNMDRPGIIGNQKNGPLEQFAGHGKGKPSAQIVNRRRSALLEPDRNSRHRERHG